MTLRLTTNRAIRLPATRSCRLRLLYTRTSDICAPAYGRALLIHQAAERLSDRLEDRRRVRGRQIHDAEVEPGRAERGRLLGQRARPRARVVAQVGGGGDLSRVPADLGAPLLQHVPRFPPHLDDAAGVVPVLGPTGRAAKGPLRTGAADADRRVRLLHRFGLAPGVGQGEVLTLE